MANGLQCFDASGNLIFDSTVKTTYVLGYGNTGTGTSGSLYNEALIGYDNSFWVAMTSFPEVTPFLAKKAPIFSLNNGTLSWSYDGNGLSNIADRSFIYGVY